MSEQARGTPPFEGGIGVIGSGRLGSALALALARSGYGLAAAASLRGESARRLAERCGPLTAAVSPSELVEGCALVFLTVPDGAIEALATSLPWRSGQAAVHCSGALGLGVLAPAAEAGAIPGCLHPLQAFPSVEGEPERFQGITCGVEGAEPLGTQLEAIARDLGATPVRLEGVDRALYHAAAVFSSNYAVALAAAATRTWEAAGLPLEQARAALAPLLVGAAENLGRHELASALTGPLARGDVATVERHLEALAREPELLALYRGLAAELLRLPLALEAGAHARLRSLLAVD